MLDTSFPPWPRFTDEEARAVSATLLSNRVNYWTGQETRAFESEYARWAGSSHAVALFNGTVALEVALKALGIGPGDEVIVTPRSFMASASCVVSAGARPIFADVDRDTQNLSAETVARVITPRTRGIIPVHLAGLPCDMDPLVDIARANQIAVIEDCAQAHGARYRGQSVGTIGDIGTWSFCQDKILTTGGEGGMVTTNSKDLWAAMWSYKDHGKSHAKMVEPHTTSGFRWVHDSFGTNARMLEIQAVIGRLQLQRLPEMTARRRQYAERIWSAARHSSVFRVPEVPGWAEHAAYRAYVFIEPTAVASAWDRDRILKEIAAMGVPCFTGSCSEIYLESAFDAGGLRPAERLPVARELGETSLAFLVHPTLEEHHISRTCDALLAVAARAAR